MAIVINGSGTITGISAGGLPDSCVTDADIAGMAASKLTGALPAISGAALTGLSSGLVMAETWRLTSNITNDGSENVITANLSKPSTPSGYGKLGSETMTESSGIFTFPSTGIYYITASSKQYSLGDSTLGNGNAILINITTDNSSYNRASYGSQAVPTTYDYASATCHLIFDVTSVSTHKLRFSHSGTSGSIVAGNANDNQTHFLFMKIGDT